MAGPKVIKRYANRKLYDTEKSCYVTLDEIARMVKEGTDVKVVDNQSKEDLTSITLAQILFEEEKKRKSVLPLQTLVGLLRTGQEAVTGFIDKTKEGAGRRVEKIETIIKAAGDTAEDRKRALGELLDGLQHNFEETQRNVDEMVKQTVSRVVPTPHLKDELKRLKKKVLELEEKLTNLE